MSDRPLRPRLRALVLTLFLGLGVLGSAAAQDETADEQDRVTEIRHVERPAAHSLRRGPLSAPAWVVYLGGGVLLLGAVGLILRKMHGRAR